MRKTAVIVMLALVSPAVVFGAGQSDRSATALVEVRQLVNDRGIIPADQGTLEDNWYVDIVNERLAPKGIRLKTVVVPIVEYGAKVATLMASGTAPDVMGNYWNGAQLGEWTNDGGLLDYAPYLDEYGPNIRKRYDDVDLAAGTFYGKLTALRRIQTWAQWSRCTYARKDYLDALGLGEPRSVDELYDALVALKKNAASFGHDPESFFPLTMWGTGEWFYYLIPAFTEGEPDPAWLNVPPQLWPAAKEALRFLNTLYNEGLMFDDSLDADQSIRKQILIDGRFGISTWWAHGPVFTGYGSIYEKMRLVNADARLVPVFPWAENPGGNRLFFNSGRYGTFFFTPSATKHPEEVVQYLDYYASEEGYRTLTIGIEGKDWALTADGGFRRLISDAEITSRISWIQPQFDTLSLAFDRASLNASVLYGSMAYADEYVDWTDAIEKAGNYAPPVVNLPTPARDRYYGPIQGDWSDAFPKILTAPKRDFDALFDEVIAAYRRNGGEAVQKEAIANYHRFYGE